MDEPRRRLLTRGDILAARDDLGQDTVTLGDGRRFRVRGPTGAEWESIARASAVRAGDVWDTLSQLRRPSIEADPERLRHFVAGLIAACVADEDREALMDAIVAGLDDASMQTLTAAVLRLAGFGRRDFDDVTERERS